MTTPYSEDTKDPSASDPDQKAVDFVADFMTESERYTRPFFEKFSVLYDEYLSARASRKNPLQRANLKPPYAFTIIETYTPHIVEAFLSDKPYIGVRGRGPEDKQWEKLIEQFLSYQMDEMHFLPKFIPFVKSLLIFGTAVAKIPWVYETKEVTKRVPSPIPGLPPQKIKARDVVKDGPDFDPVALIDFFPDPHSSKPGDIQAMRGCVHRIFRSYDEIKKREKKKLPDGTTVGIYSNLDALKQSIDSSDDDSHDSGSAFSDDRFLAKRDRLYGVPADTKRKNDLELREYWGIYDLEGNGKLQEVVLTVANSKFCIRRDVNPLDNQIKPFVGAVNYPIEGEFYGIGELEPVWSLLKEATALRNARLDNVNQAVNRMWIIDRAAGINVRNLYSRAGGIILSNDINGIKPLDPPEVVGSSFREMDSLDFGIQQAVALPNPGAGAGKVAGGYSRTATGVNYLQSLTSSRLSLKIRLLSALAFDRFARIMMMLNSQFMDDTYIRVMGDQQNPFELLPSDAFSKEYDFTLDSAIDRLAKKDRQANLYQNIIPLMEMGEKYRPGLIAWDKFVPATLNDFDYRETSQFVNTPEVQQQFQQSQAQGQQQAAQANADAQASAQAKLIMLKGQVEGSNDQQYQENQITADVVKQMIDASQKEKAA